MKISDIHVSAIKEEETKPQQTYNIVNISKDDAESIINLLKDYVTVDLGNGKQIKIPKLNLALLPNIFPHEKISKIFTPTGSSPDKMMVAVANQSSFQNNTTNEEQEFADLLQSPIKNEPQEEQNLIFIETNGSADKQEQLQDPGFENFINLSNIVPDIPENNYDLQDNTYDLNDREYSNFNSSEIANSGFLDLTN